MLLKKAVNDSADECGPDCDDYAHGESCPACDPAKWLVDQQVEIERLRSRLAEAERSIDTLLGMIRHQRDVLRECLPYLNESMAGKRPGRSADDIRASVKALTADKSADG